MADVAEEIVEAVEEVVEEIEEEEEEFVAAGATEIKLFGKWSFDDIEIRDISLEVSFRKNIILRVDSSDSSVVFFLLLLLAFLTCSYFLPRLLITRITLLARVTMLFIFHTLPDDTNKRDSARHLVQLLNVLYAV